MELNDGREGIYEFGEFRLNVGQLMLYRGNVEITLRPKAVETLIALVERRGEIVTKDDLMKIIWSDAIVEESNLSRYIHILRSVLGKQSDGKPYIETYRRRGFRFNSEVTKSVAASPLHRAHARSVAHRIPTGEGRTGNVVQLAEWRHDVGAERHAPAISEAANNLPTPLTQLIGRESDLVEVSGLLRKPTTRLVTLTGTGGTGKTRLGLEVGRELLGEFAEGVFFVQLAPVRDTALVPLTISRALNIQESGGASLEDLKAFLQHRSVLIVLDNFEQLLDASPLVAELLEACPHVKVLATSRTALHIRGEYEYSVPPLSLPADDSIRSADALNSAAVRLFVERAAQANFRFALRDDNAATVIEICRRVDGLPLAIELAALRIRNLSAKKVLDRLADRLLLLSDGPRDLPERQKTMSGAIAWSYELLTNDEKSLFRCLAIFNGDFSTEAVEHVTSKKPVPGDASRTETVDALMSLVDRGLLLASEVRDGALRFRMLEVVREFALKLLEGSHDADEIHRRHALYYSTLGERAEPHLLTAEAGVWVNRLELEHPNLRSAMQWLFENDATRAAHFAAAIRVYLFVQSRFAEGREWLRVALERNATLLPEIRFNLINNLGLFALASGNHDEAREKFELNLAESQELDEKIRIADSLRGLGATLNSQLDLPRAKECFSEALAIYRTLGDDLGIARSLLGLGSVTLNENVEKSRTLFEGALNSFRKVGYQSGTCTCLINLGEAAWRSGDHESANEFFTEALPIAVSENYRDRISFCLNGFAALAATRGDWKNSARLTGAAEKLRETIGYRPEPQDDDFRRLYLEGPRTNLGRLPFSFAHREGREMKLEDAIAVISEAHIVVRRSI